MLIIYNVILLFNKCSFTLNINSVGAYTLCSIINNLRPIINNLRPIINNLRPIINNLRPIINNLRPIIDKPH